MTAFTASVPHVAISRSAAFDSTLISDLGAAADYFAEVAARLQTLGPVLERDAAARQTAAALKRDARAARERFFRRHIVSMYEDLTDGLTVARRVPDLLYAAADRFPGLLPSRSRIDGERKLMRQAAKEGHEVDQGLFIAHILADERCGMHLIHAMLKPKAEALAKRAEFARTGFVDLGRATVERKGIAGHITLTNPEFLNAEDDPAAAALETAVDLVLLDDRIEVGVLRGDRLTHPKYAGRRVFNSGINLTHLYYGQISLAEFMIDRELGLLNKIYRGHWLADSYAEQFEDTVEKPFLAVVESFAIGGGCQLLCVMDRVLAEPGAYFNLPASKEGFIPGSAPLRLPRLVGIQQARQGIFFEKAFAAESVEGRMICDAIVPADRMDDAIERDTAHMVQAGSTSTVSNRKALRVGEEPLPVYRRFMATYARQQSLCLYDQALISNLERSWQPEKRKFVAPPSCAAAVS